MELGTVQNLKLKPQRRLHLPLIGLAMELNLDLVVIETPASRICSRGG
jgi:hypothetical protein